MLLNIKLNVLVTVRCTWATQLCNWLLWRLLSWSGLLTHVSNLSINAKCDVVLRGVCVVTHVVRIIMNRKIRRQQRMSKKSYPSLKNVRDVAFLIILRYQQNILRSVYSLWYLWNILSMCHISCCHRILTSYGAEVTPSHIRISFKANGSWLTLRSFSTALVSKLPSEKKWSNMSTWILMESLTMFCLLWTFQLCYIWCSLKQSNDGSSAHEWHWAPIVFLMTQYSSPYYSTSCPRRN